MFFEFLAHEAAENGQNCFGDILEVVSKVQIEDYCSVEQILFLDLELNDTVEVNLMNGIAKNWQMWLLYQNIFKFLGHKTAWNAQNCFGDVLEVVSKVQMEDYSRVEYIQQTRNEQCTF